MKLKILCGSCQQMVEDERNHSCFNHEDLAKPAPGLIGAKPATPQVFKVGNATIELRPGISPFQVAMIKTAFTEEGLHKCAPGTRYLWDKGAKKYVAAPASKEELLARIHARKKVSQTEKLRGKFLSTWKECFGPELAEEYCFHPLRKWRFDFCIPSIRVGIEIDGGVFINGGHNRGAQISQDYVKRNTALTLGYRVFQLTTIMMKPEHLNPIVAVCNRLLK